MNKDERVVLFLDFVAPSINLMGPEADYAKQLTVSNMLQNDPVISIQDIPRITYEMFLPDVRQYAHMLAEWGLQPKGIAKVLNVSVASISYHLKRTPKTYENQHLMFLRMEQSDAQPHT